MENTENRYQHFYRNLITYLPVVASIVAIIFELGYYSVIGFNFFSVVPLYDHFISAVIALPFSMLGMIVGLTTHTASNSKKSEGKREKNPLKEALIMSIVTYAFLIIAYSINYYTLAISITSAYVSISYLDSLYRESDADALVLRKSKALYYIIGPLLISSIFAFGAVRATSAIESDDTVQINICKQNADCKTYNAVKVFSRSALVKTTTNISYIDFEHPIEISTSTPDTRHLLERLYDYLF